MTFMLWMALRDGRYRVDWLHHEIMKMNYVPLEVITANSGGM